ncbi:hypothetical protein LTS07_004669 [Exophiala sideris]|uniref:Uncharacterized protein n=1 Tax=Exophiala sideris TaxID=1016849 RepID=A0ABR0JD05_9EURO|nr:hypothetical protein LTS07_004669 [Exophiala sideris]KAK5040975.1 hypothetical protein LTR13_003277 [Exophiala sideris]KAK5061691.1 hypothetical protein LTR69_004873 [Exophiala sideris]KAK5184391.1 hypothetical protein LTR44_003064 [Eurotiomycetes sp. CCFEE 6388]
MCYWKEHQHRVPPSKDGLRGGGAGITVSPIVLILLFTFGSSDGKSSVRKRVVAVEPLTQRTEQDKHIKKHMAITREEQWSDGIADMLFSNLDASKMEL